MARSPVSSRDGRARHLEKAEAAGRCARGRRRRPTSSTRLRVRYLGRKSELKHALREVRDRETGHGAERRPRARSRTPSPSARRRSSAPSSTARCPRTSSTSRCPARRSRSAACTRSRRSRREIEDAFLGLGYEVRRRPRGRDGRVQLRQARVRRRRTRRARRGTRSSSTTTRVLRTETSPSQIHVHGGAGSRRSTWSRSAASTGATRSTRRTTRSSTSSRASPSTAGSRSPTSRARCCTSCARSSAPEREVRFRTHFFPFTEPSIEPDVSCWHLRRRGLPHAASTRAGSRWAAPAWSTRRCSRTSASTPRSGPGFAFGCGLERIAQLRHDIPDIRALWEGDLRVLRQF